MIHAVTKRLYSWTDYSHALRQGQGWWFSANLPSLEPSINRSHTLIFPGRARVEHKSLGTNALLASISIPPTVSIWSSLYFCVALDGLCFCNSSCFALKSKMVFGNLIFSYLVAVRTITYRYPSTFPLHPDAPYSLLPSPSPCLLHWFSRCFPTCPSNTGLPKENNHQHLDRQEL